MADQGSPCLCHGLIRRLFIGEGAARELDLAVVERRQLPDDPGQDLGLPGTHAPAVLVREEIREELHEGREEDGAEDDIALLNADRPDADDPLAWDDDALPSPERVHKRVHVQVVDDGEVVEEEARLVVLQREGGGAPRLSILQGFPGQGIDDARAGLRGSGEEQGVDLQALEQGLQDRPDRAPARPAEAVLALGQDRLARLDEAFGQELPHVALDHSGHDAPSPRASARSRVGRPWASSPRIR